MAPRQLSVQGEQQHEHEPTRASLQEVDSYVDRVSDAVIECRQRGRHLWPALRAHEQPFSGVDETGLFVRRIVCNCCGLAVRVERWEVVGRGRNTRLQLVTHRLEYIAGENGETYLAPSGQGRMTPRQVASSVATRAMQGHSIAGLRKSLPRV